MGSPLPFPFSWADTCRQGTRYGVLDAARPGRWQEAQKGLGAGGQRGKMVNEAHRSLLMALPASACTFYRWEVRIPKDADRRGH